MIEIKDLLLKFNNLLISGELKKDLIAETISSIVGISVKRDDVVVKSGTLYLNIKPIYKNEIFKKRDQIINELSVVLGKNHPKDIR